MSRGHDRERAVVHLLRDDDWIAFRAPASLGVADIIALKAGERPMLCEVKSTHRGPYHGFGPADRQKLRLAGEMAGASVFLVWWPPRGKAVWLAPDVWPGALEAVA